MSDEKLIPTDAYSRELAHWRDNPEAITAESTIETKDFYGNTETWVVRTIDIRGEAWVFLQRLGADDKPIRLVLPPKISAAIYRHRDAATARRVKRGARKAAATREAAGVRPFVKKAK